MLRTDPAAPRDSAGARPGPRLTDVTHDEGDRNRAPGSPDAGGWPAGTDADVEWIRQGTTIGRDITSAIPAVFAGYATIVVPADPLDQADHEQLMLALLRAATPSQSWWLGYLDTGAGDEVLPAARRVRLYASWSYVLILAGADQADQWRDRRDWSRRGRLPELIFPRDRSWLLSTLWDDDWRCLGGPKSLIDQVVSVPGLEARRVEPGEDATPPGHTAY